MNKDYQLKELITWTYLWLKTKKGFTLARGSEDQDTQIMLLRRADEIRQVKKAKGLPFKTDEEILMPTSIYELGREVFNDPWDSGEIPPIPEMR